MSIDLAALFGASDASTFLGVDACDDLSTLDASSAFLGVPCATPYAAVGAYARGGPASLRKAAAALTANLDRMNFDLGGPIFPDGTRRAVDCGDLEFSENDFAANRTHIRDTVARIVARGAVPIVIGGDDSVPIPMIDALGVGAGSYTILQIDAHIDWRQEHMGETHGLSSTMRRASEMAHVAKIIQVGARGIGSAETGDYRDALDWGVRFHTARDIAAKGVAAALDAIGTGEEIILCIDIDALDPAIAPNTIGRAPGGLGYWQVLDLIEGAAARGRIAAVDFVEILPEADVDGIGALTVSRLVAATMGVIARAEMRDGA